MESFPPEERWKEERVVSYLLTDIGRSAGTLMRVTIYSFSTQDISVLTLLSIVRRARDLVVYIRKYVKIVSDAR